MDKIGKEIVSEGLFERFPELVPAVGDKYWSDNHSKLLLIAESNYFSDEMENKSVFKDAEKWYKEQNAPLIPEEMKKNVCNWIGEGYRPFDNLFKSMKTVLNESNIEYDDYLLKETAFYNYFLRPASKRNGNIGFKKDCKPIDKEVSGLALCGIIDKYSPDIVIFVSKYAWEEFTKYCQRENKTFTAKIEFVYHPSRHFSWNHRYGLGQQKFESLLKEYWIK
jgi:hypothetical protein